MAIKPKNPRIVKAKPKPRPTSTAKPAPKAKVTKSRGSKTAKQMGDMNTRENYNSVARTERVYKNSSRRGDSSVTRDVKSYGDKPPGFKGPRTRTSGEYDTRKQVGNTEGSATYYDYLKKGTKYNNKADQTNMRAGGSKNLSAYEKAVKSQAKGVANKPKGSMAGAKRAAVARKVKGRAGK